MTGKLAPQDIDLVAVLMPGHDFERDLPMSQYALVSRAMLRRRFGFDVVIADAAVTSTIPTLNWSAGCVIIPT